MSARSASPRVRKPTHGGSRADAGRAPPRGQKASVTISVRLTPSEALELDRLLASFPGLTRAAFALEAVMRAVRGMRAVQGRS
jgi:hypothetical protein